METLNSPMNKSQWPLKSIVIVLNTTLLSTTKHKDNLEFPVPSGQIGLHKSGTIGYRIGPETDINRYRFLIFVTGN
jgi:hypothetical protein